MFTVRRDTSTSSSDGTEASFFCIECPDWVNVIPVTADGIVVLIEQYRQGIEEVTLEIPGGMIDAGEDPLAAARRELLEETGYAAREFVSLGKSRPNPALQNNWVHHFLARDAIYKQAPDFDTNEHVVTRSVAMPAVRDLILQGAISHSLVLAAFHRLALHEHREPQK